jgi:hypothetical protein
VKKENKTIDWSKEVTVDIEVMGAIIIILYSIGIGAMF